MLQLPRVGVAVLSLAAVGLAQGKNILFYGNSLSLFNCGVAAVVRGMAIDAGFPAPTCQLQLVSGMALHFHATDPAQIAAITNSLPPGQHWDFVVMQGISHETTTTLGNPTQFAADAATILGNVRNHSPAAVGVLFQTYARAQGHAWYPGTFANPMVMNEQVRTTYRNTTAQLNALFGPGAAVNSAVGDCAALIEFAPSYYFTDLQHPAPALTFLSGMCLFSTIYARRACDVTPNVGQPSALATLLTNYNWNLNDWRRLAGIADRCAARSLRRYPGSGDQLLLETGTVPGYCIAAPVDDVTLGTPFELRLSSKNGRFDTAPAMLIARLFTTGMPPQPPGQYPELAISPASLSILLTTPNLASPLAFSLNLPFTLPGLSLMIQGVALAPSSETGNQTFTATDGHELVFH